MQQWLATQVANGFSAFAGSSITGTIRLNESLLNEALAEALKDAVSGNSGTGTAPDLKPMLKLVKRAELHAEAGAVSVNVEIRI
jgi:hypothetical protein